MPKVYIDTGVGTRLIGKIEDGVFTSKRHSSKHLYQKLNAWGIDCMALDGMLKSEELHTVIIMDLDTKTNYVTEAEQFKQHGIILHHKPHRPQVFLPLDYWQAES